METMQDVLEAMNGFMRSRAILTAAELDIFTRVDKQPLGAADLARELGADERGVTRLLDCLVALGLLKKNEGRYSPSNAGALLSARPAGSVLPMARHMNAIWGNWSRLTGAVRQGRNVELEPVVDAAPEENREAFIGAMHAIAGSVAGDVVGAYDATRFKTLLDIGGGSGAYTIAFLRRNPGMKAVLFDLEGVIPIARRMLAESGLADRVELAAGDFYTDELPGGCDLALLSAIIHQNDPPQNLALYQKVRRALAPGGALLIRDHIMDPARTKPAAGALFALNMLVNTEGGDTYTFDEVAGPLRAAGFESVRWVRSGDKMDSLIEARTSGAPERG